jgi:PilZ domain
MSSNSRMLASKTMIGAIAANGDGAKGDQKIQLCRVECYLTESLFRRILRRMFPDQRKQERLPEPPLVGYLGTACSSRPYGLGDISLTGFCLLTDERWLPGTEMPVTLQRMNLPGKDDADYFTVQATVVRSDKKGVGFSVVLSENDSRAAYGNPLRVKWVTKPEMEQFLQRLKEQPGSGASENEGPVPPETAAGAPIRTRAALKAAFEGGR